MAPAAIAPAARRRAFATLENLVLGKEHQILERAEAMEADNGSGGRGGREEKEEMSVGESKEPEEEFDAAAAATEKEDTIRSARDSEGNRIARPRLPPARSADEAKHGDEDTQEEDGRLRSAAEGKEKDSDDDDDDDTSSTPLQSIMR